MTREEVIDLATRKRSAPNDTDDESEDDNESNTKATIVDQNIVEKLQEMSRNLEDISVSGVDLGIRNVAATVRRTWHKSSASDYEIHESNILHKSKDYHYEAGFHKRNRIRRKLVGGFDDEYQKDRRSNAVEPSQKSGNHVAYIRSRLKWFNQGTEAYMKRQVCNLKFSKHKSTQKQLTKMAKDIVGDIDLHNRIANTRQQHRVVFVGDCATPANSTIKGHRRSPGHKPLYRYLKQRPNTTVISQDEFRTTRNCSKCFEELENVESSKERLKTCTKNCRPKEDSMPAIQIATYRAKRAIDQQMKEDAGLGSKPTQAERKQRTEHNSMDRWTDLDVKRIDKRRSLKYVTYEAAGHTANRYWNRDINAARNIAYLGLCRYGRYINECLIFKEDTAFSRKRE